MLSISAWSSPALQVGVSGIGRDEATGTMIAAMAVQELPSVLDKRCPGSRFFESRKQLNAKR